LPNLHPLRAKYRELKNSSGPAKLALAEWLKTQLLPGSIEVNIMTKCDRPNFDENDEALPQEYSDALSALRGYANSNLRSSIIFSAGMNPRVFSYCAKFHDFFPDVDNDLKKQKILKVSDYRSANVLSPEQLRLRNMAQTAQLIIQDTIKHPETKSAKEQLEY
jgi:hypothetical protein